MTKSKLVFNINCSKIKTCNVYKILSTRFFPKQLGTETHDADKDADMTYLCFAKFYILK